MSEGRKAAGEIADEVAGQTEGEVVGWTEGEVGWIADAVVGWIRGFRTFFKQRCFVDWTFRLIICKAAHFLLAVFFQQMQQWKQVVNTHKVGLVKASLRKKDSESF